MPLKCDIFPLSNGEQVKQGQRLSINELGNMADFLSAVAPHDAPSGPPGSQGFRYNGGTERNEKGKHIKTHPHSPGRHPLGLLHSQYGHVIKSLCVFPPAITAAFVGVGSCHSSELWG